MITFRNKKQLFVQSQIVVMFTDNHVIFFEENWNFKVSAIYMSKLSSNSTHRHYEPNIWTAECCLQNTNCVS